MPKIDGNVLCAYLDDEWRTPIGIKRRFHIKGRGEEIRHELDRLAEAGRIERAAEPVRSATRRSRGRLHEPQQRAVSIVRYRKRS